jgi:hypothetical protein
MKSTYCEYILEKILSTSEVGPILALIAPSPLRNSVDRALDMSSYLYVLGDTNVKNHKLIDLITHFTLNNIITGPTRLCNTRESLLDIILFSDACKCTESSIIAVDQDISDHHATVAVIDIPIELKGNFAIFYMLAKYVPGDIKYIFTKFYRHISTNNEANRKFVILISNFSTRLLFSRSLEL